MSEALIFLLSPNKESVPQLRIVMFSLFNPIGSKFLLGIFHQHLVQVISIILKDLGEDNDIVQVG